MTIFIVRCLKPLTRRESCVVLAIFAEIHLRSPAKFSQCAIFPATSSVSLTLKMTWYSRLEISPAKVCLPRCGFRIWSPRSSCSSRLVAMLPGDTLVGYSDGALECRNSFGEEFGSDGLLTTARNSCGSAASAALFSVLAAVEDFTGRQRREDDISLIVAHRAAQ